MAKILYFVGLVDQLGLSSEDAERPEEVADVRSLLQWLHKRGRSWQQALPEDNVQVTVNRQFAEADSPVTDKDEIAILARGR